MLTFTYRHSWDISDNNPQDANSVGILDDNLIIIHPAMEIPGVDTTTEPAETARVDPDFDVEITGVDMDTNAWAMDTDVPVDNNAVALDDLELKILLRAPLHCSLMSQPIAQRRQRAQPRDCTS
jgi:hypothetical protein